PCSNLPSRRRSPLPVDRSGVTRRPAKCSTHGTRSTGKPARHQGQATGGSVGEIHRSRLRGSQMQRDIAQLAVVRYAVAVLCVTAAVILALWLRPVVLGGAQLLLVAILITGWVSGLRPALVAWGLAMLAFDYYFTPPFDSLKIEVAEAVAAQQRFRDLVNSVEGIVWEADATTFQFLFVSNQAERILG